MDCEQAEIGQSRDSPFYTSDNTCCVAHGLALLHEIRMWCVVREGRCRKKRKTRKTRPAQAPASYAAQSCERATG
jgi:hypothetical protein